MTAPRYDLQPLLTAAGLTRRQLRTRLGVSNDTLNTLEVDGLTDEQADRYAIRVGLYPWQVWATWLDDGAGWDLDHPSLRHRTVPPVRSSCEQP